MTRDKQPRRPAPSAAGAKAAASREARGSVHEAIGKLIGDDAAQARGKAEKHAGAAAGAATDTSSRD